jgi:hypothetical protein
VVYEDRAPAPEELQKILNIADLRERTIITLLALGGFRIGTLSKLQYRHVKRDLEKGISPIHIHVESEITKGKYHDYDTFIGQEAAENLKTYLEIRRLGTRKKHPEIINDNSPLIRDGQSNIVRPISTGRLHTLIHNLYVKAGLVTHKPRGRRYDLRAHSIRKYFRTQLASLGMQTDYIDYMMGHTISTYHDIRMKGIEFLRGIYISSGLSIAPKTRLNKIDALKELISAWGLNPDQILSREALSQGNVTVTDRAQFEQTQITQLTFALKQQMIKEIRENHTGNSTNSCAEGYSP